MRLLAAAVSVACAIAPRFAAAAPLGATIVVERSERASDCPDAPELTRQVEQILERSLEREPSALGLEVAVHFSWSREQYLADVVSRGPKPGERLLHDRGQSCAALAQAVSVAIALLLDKELEHAASLDSERHTPSGAAESEPARLGPARPSAGHAQEASPASGHAASVELRASVEVGPAVGLVAESSPLLSEQLGVRLQRHVIFDAGFSAVLPASTPYGAGSVRTTLLFGTARACYVWGETLTLGPCASFGAGKLAGVGIGYHSVDSQRLSWTAFGVGGIAEGPIWGRVFGGVSGVLWVPTHGSSFKVQNVGTAWESSRVAGAVGIRLGFRIW